MLSKKMRDALNTHMNKELYSAHLYLSMASHAGYSGLKGTANWFYVQYQEEMVHFMKFYTYLNSQGEHVTLGPSEKVPDTFKGLTDMYQQALKHEQYITSCINDLMDQAVKEKDHGSQIFLQWFVTEQIEEEENDRDILGKLKLIGNNGQGLLMLDNELGTRVFTPPPTQPAA